ncbi:MAG: hypothetical protein ACRCUJ_04945 [Phocaeicola sp.]
MKYILLFLSSWLGLTACTQQEELLAGDNYSTQLLESPYQVNVQWASPFSAELDSCVITTIAHQPHMLPTSFTVVGSSLQFGDEHVATLFESSECYEAIRCAFYLSTSAGSQSYVTSITEPMQSHTAYTFVLNQLDSEWLLSLSVTPWQEGGILVTGPDAFQYKLDVVQSQLPEYVRISATKDTLYLPACQSELLISLTAQIEAGWMLQGTPLTMKRVEGMDYLANQFRITLPAKSLGDQKSVSTLFFGERGSNEFSENPLVIVQEPLRIELLDNQAVTVGNSVSYTTYIDGTLASVKEGYSVQSYTIDSDSQDDYEWIVMQRKGANFTIEGGFKPNDSGAYGQSQTSHITVEYSDGVEEHYAFTRRRYALPVVKFGNHYWSKFNMRGNSKGYDDQIGFDMDRADMWGYLKDCYGASFIAYAGSQYCGTNPEGLDMYKNLQGTLTYYGYPYAFEGSSINDIQSHTHCPPGYQVPTQQEMQELIGGSVVHLTPLLPKESDQNGFLVNKKRYTVERYRRSNVTHAGVTLYDLYHLKITNLQGEELVLHGMGYQSENNVINYGYWLFAAVSSGKDQAGFNNPRNNFYMQGHSGQKTVSVRCVKTPVNYVID